MKKLISVILVCVLSVLWLAGCSNTSTDLEAKTTQSTIGSSIPVLQGTGTVEIDIEDAPPTTAIDHIWVTFKSIEVHETTGPWVKVTTPTGRFDLETLNELSIKAASEATPTGFYNEIRFGIAAISVETGGQSYSATVPSGVIRLAGNFNVANGKITTVTLDFELNNSLNVTGNNKYIFKPVVHFLTPKADDALGIVATGLNNGLAGTPYRDRVSISGGKRPYIYNITSGNIPPGINFDENNGVFSGTPSQAGNYNFTVLVKDSTTITQTDIASYVIRIGPSNGLVIETNTLPNGIAGEPYDTDVFALGGNGTYTWQVTDGSLPPGLQLTITTGEIGGTTTTAGDYSFRLQVHDSSNPQLTDSQSFNMHVQ